MRTRVASIPPPAKDPDEFLRAAGQEAAQRWDALAANAPSGWEFWIRDALTGLNAGNPNHLELAVSKAREVLEKIPDPAVRETYRDRAAGWIGVQPHLLAAGAAQPQSRVQNGKNHPQPGLPAAFRGKTLSASRYLLQLLAVRPVAFEVVRTKLTPEELDLGDRNVFLRMLGSYDRGGESGLEKDLGGYPAEEQDLIRRAWAAPPPSVDDEVAEELAGRIRLDYMKGMHSGIIRELSEAERGTDSERVARLETEARELARAITDMERSS
jgi:DNA primase